MLRQKIIRKKALEIMITKLNTIELNNIQFKDYSEETNDKIKEFIGLRIDKLKDELKKL